MYPYKYLRETAQMAGISLPALARDFQAQCKETPTLGREVNRLAWLRSTGQQLQRVKMVGGTRVKSVDSTINLHFSADTPHVMDIRR